MRRTLLPSIALALWTLTWLAAWLAPGAPILAAEATPETVRVAQDGTGDFEGTDETPILEAIAKVKPEGGTVAIGPGRYLIRRPVVLHGGVALRGSGQTVLQLPRPVLVTSAAAKGRREITVSDALEFAAETTVELFPPEGTKLFSDEATESFRTGIARIDGRRIALAEPLPVDLPASSRMGYPHNIVIVPGGTEDVTIEKLTFDGGRTPALPIPGHHRRSGIWATGRYSYEGGPSGPPVARLVVRDCVFQNCYGRGVAMYSVVDSEVSGSTFRGIADEAIDFDHFCLRCKAVDNEITEAVCGVTLNDASHCLIERNRLTGCGTGINVWWWYRCPQEGLNEHNTIRHNVIASTKGRGISLGKRCHHNVVRHNTVEGEIHVVEPGNTVEDNRTP